jgi:hypothetical protein
MPKVLPILIFALCVFSAAGMAVAQTAAAGGSNIALSEYPGPSCVRPQAAPPKPQLPPDEEAPGAAEAYNLRVQQYNKAIAGYNAAMALFGSCMQTYVENGNADMARIKQKLDEAVAAANAH